MKILLAYDGSEGAEAALESIASRPWPSPLGIVVLEVLDLRAALAAHVGLLVQSEAYRNVVAQARAAAEGRLAEARKRLAERVPMADVHAQVSEGAPAAVIVAAAAEHNVDLVLMGAHGYGALARALLGSVSSKVALHAHCAVEIVKVPSTAPPAGFRVLLGTDFSESAQHAAEWIRSAEWPQDTRVRLVSAIPPLPSLAATEVGGHEMLREAELAQSARREADQKLSQLRAGLVAKFGADAVTCEVWDGDPRDVLVDVATHWPASLIVLGSRGRTGLKRLLLGSVANGVLHTAPCSVHIAR